MAIITVKSCGDCPFFDIDSFGSYWSCLHPNTQMKERYFRNDMEWINSERCIECPSEEVFVEFPKKPT